MSPLGKAKEMAWHRPTVLFAVPRVYDIFKKTIEAQLAMKSPPPDPPPFSLKHDINVPQSGFYRTRFFM